MLTNILYFISILFQVSAISYMLIKFYEINTSRNSNKKQIIFVFVSLFIYYIISLKIEFPYKTILFILFLLLCFTINYKINISKAVLLSSLLMIIYSIIEIFCVFIFSIILSIPSGVLTNNILASNKAIKSIVIIFYSIILVIFTLLTCKIYTFRKNNINNFFYNISSKQLKLFTFIVITCIFPQILLFMINRYEYPLYLLIINCIQIVVFSIILLKYINQTIEQEKTKNELILSELHNKTMIGMIDGVRIMKHDYNNIIQALSGYVATKQYDKLEQHINSVMKECNAINTLSAITTEVFNEPAIYGVVGSKYFIATEKDIDFKIEITTDISKINFPMPKLSRILGILLDNAIEATSKFDNKYICLQMNYDNRKNADIIKVINTYDTNNKIDFEKIYSKGFSTKKVKSGIGLWEVKKIIDKSKNAQIFPSIDKDKFIQTIIVEK